MSSANTNDAGKGNDNKGKGQEVATTTEMALFSQAELSLFSQANKRVGSKHVDIVKAQKFFIKSSWELWNARTSVEAAGTGSIGSIDLARKMHLRRKQVLDSMEFFHAAISGLIGAVESCGELKGPDVKVLATIDSYNKSSISSFKTIFNSTIDASAFDASADTYVNILGKVTALIDAHYSNNLGGLLSLQEATQGKNVELKTPIRTVVGDFTEFALPFTEELIAGISPQVMAKGKAGSSNEAHPKTPVDNKVVSSLSSDLLTIDLTGDSPDAKKPKAEDTSKGKGKDAPPPPPAGAAGAAVAHGIANGIANGIAFDDAEEEEGGGRTSDDFVEDGLYRFVNWIVKNKQLGDEDSGAGGNSNENAESLAPEGEESADVADTADSGVVNTIIVTSNGDSKTLHVKPDATIRDLSRLHPTSLSSSSVFLYSDHLFHTMRGSGNDRLVDGHYPLPDNVAIGCFATAEAAGRVLRLFAPDA